MDPLFIKPADAARALNIGRTLFYRLVKAGAIPSVRIGKAIRIPVGALKAWADAQGEKHAGSAPVSQ